MRPDGKRQEISRRVRLKDIAERCGVSTATVSRALSGPGGPDAARIRAVAAALNYPMPSSQAGRRVLLAASAPALIDAARSQFTLHVLEGLRERAATLGMSVETRALTPDLLAEAAADDGLAGVLLLTIDDPATLAEAAALGKPVVLVNGDDPQMRLSSVAPCNRSAASLGAAALRGLGHRRILLLKGPGRRTIQRREEGFRDAMQGAEPLVLEVPDWTAAAAESALAALPQGVTAILASGDALAFGACAALRGRVPARVSVLSIDGLPQSGLHDPPLSVVEIPMRAIGAVALDLLVEARSRDLPPRRVELACRLVLRGTTAVAPGA